MHCDEAVHAVKFGRLLQSGDYVYNRREYHGPSLYYLTLPIARLASARNLTEITEIHLRLVPAIFGIVLVGLVWLVREELGRPAALGAAALTAVSPAMVFYSRYYIQEMLLVCFTFGAMVALWRYLGELAAVGAEPPESRRRSWIRQTSWLVMLGVCIGMMHASKETCAIALFAMVVAAALTIRAHAVGRDEVPPRPACTAGTASQPTQRTVLAGLFWPGLVVVLCAATVSALFFSSFLRHPRGIVDSLTTYFVYLGRASGEGTAGRHYQPWHYYFRILFWWHRGSGPVWSEASIAALALVGLVSGVRGEGRGARGEGTGDRSQASDSAFSIQHSAFSIPFARFLGIYTLLMTAVYSALPYKTPWCALGFLHGMILLAGVGMGVLVRAAPGYAAKTAVIALLVAATAHLGWQAHRASFVLYEDPSNPYVYAHTTSDVPLLAERIRQIAAVHGDGPAMHVQVLCPDDDHWPLPWYLRDFSRVDWLPGIPRGRAAPLIITQPTMEKAVLEYVYVKQPPGQRPLRDLLQKPDGTDWQLRPHVPLLMIVRRDLLEAYRLHQAKGTAPDREEHKGRPSPTEPGG